MDFMRVVNTPNDNEKKRGEKAFKKNIKLTDGATFGLVDHEKKR